MPDPKPRGPRGPYKKNRTSLLETAPPRGVRLSSEVMSAAKSYCARSGDSFNQLANQAILWFCRVEAAKDGAPPPAAKRIEITVDQAAAAVADAARQFNRRIDPDKAHDRSWIYARAGALGLPRRHLDRELVAAVVERLGTRTLTPTLSSYEPAGGLQR